MFKFQIRPLQQLCREKIMDAATFHIIKRIQTSSIRKSIQVLFDGLLPKTLISYLEEIYYDYEHLDREPESFPNWPATCYIYPENLYTIIFKCDKSTQTD